MDDRPKVPVEDQPICRLIHANDAGPLGRLFERLASQGAEEFFHPHPLTREAAAQRAAYTGKDLYSVLQVGTEFVGYGILHGWDKGYQIPGLGIAIDPGQQSKGYGRRFMGYLHGLARQRGAKRVRLRVDPANVRAVKLYESMGYIFDPALDPDGQLIGFLDLDAGKPPVAKEPTE
jgi:[ribosomal protein S18]-alanine N-acetyltransferase